jgi:hypothetical protein
MKEWRHENEGEEGANFGSFLFSCLPVKKLSTKQGRFIFCNPW